MWDHTTSGICGRALRSKVSRLPKTLPTSTKMTNTKATKISSDSLPPEQRVQLLGSGRCHSQQGATTWVLVLFVIAILVTALVALLFGQKIGYQRGYHSSQTQIAERADGASLSAEQVKELRQQNEILNSDIATAKQELAISLASVDELRQKDEALKVTNRQVNQANQVLRGYIAEHGGMPLEVLGAKIVPLPEKAFEYRFDVAMVSKDGSAETLTPKLTLLNEDSLVEVPLDPKRYDINGVARIRGRFMMPKDFEPLQLKLSLSAGGQRTQQLYDWQLGGLVEDMPLSLAELPEVDRNPVDDFE